MSWKEKNDLNEFFFFFFSSAFISNNSKIYNPILSWFIKFLFQKPKILNESEKGNFWKNIFLTKNPKLRCHLNNFGIFKSNSVNKAKTEIFPRKTKKLPKTTQIF